jgi:gamma-glutamyltranspeptidase/glutathione hydrolase
MAYVDDPAFADVPYTGIVSKAFANQRRETIAPDRALDEVVPGDPWPFNDSGAGQPMAQTVSWRGSDNHTTHFNVVDHDRTIVSMTQSIIDAFGSGVVVPGTGMLLNSAMHNFNPLPGQIGSVAPWKRSAHNGVPVIVLREDGRPFLAIGGAGGTKIISGVAQMLVNLIDRGWSAQDVVAAPRVHNEGWDSQIDARIASSTREDLRRRGHQLEVVTSAYGTPGFSRINAIVIDADDRLTSGIDVYSEAGAAVSE